MQTADQQQQPASTDTTQQPEDPRHVEHPITGEQQQHGNESTQDEQRQVENEEDKDKPRLTPAEMEVQRLRRRIDRLTRSKYQSEAERTQLQREIDQLRGHDGQRRDDGSDSDERAAPSREDLQRQAREMVEAERINARCDDVAAKGEASFPDFGEKVIELGQELPLFDQRGPTQIMKAILDSDDPAALIYHLGSNPDEAAELADMSPRQQLRQLIKIEAQIDSAPPPTQQNAQSQQQPAAAPKVSKAPPPVQPNRSAAGDVAKDPSKMSDAEYFAWRKTQRSH